MWFVVGLISFFVGLFTTTQFAGMVFYEIPYLTELKQKEREVLNKVYWGIAFQGIIFVISLILTFTALMDYWYIVMITYYIIPIIVAICQKETMISDMKSSIKNIIKF